MPLKKKRSKIRFEIHLAEHCNLKCCACNNFSCIAEPELVDVEEFSKDMKRLGEIFSHECESILLIGGEPLLHPEIITLMKIARENFRHGEISIFTNGILLAGQKNEFWQSCHENNISITISPYPIKLDTGKIKSQSEKFGVKCKWALSRDSFYIEPLNLDGNSDINLNFGLCVRANGCISLSHGRLFTCTFVPNVHHFNKKFGTSIPVTRADYVDIYDDNITPDAILQKMSEPIPACRYCDVRNSSIREIKWGITQGKIEEWI